MIMSSDPGSNANRMVEKGKFIFDSNYIDYDDLENNTVINRRIIIDGDCELGDSEDILSCAISLAQHQNEALGWSYVIFDTLDEGERDNILCGEHMDNLFYLDCSEYGGDSVAVDPFDIMVEPIGNVPDALNALKEFVADCR